MWPFVCLIGFSFSFTDSRYEYFWNKEMQLKDHVLEIVVIV